MTFTMTTILWITMKKTKRQVREERENHTASNEQKEIRKISCLLIKIALLRSKSLGQIPGIVPSYCENKKK